MDSTPVGRTGESNFLHAIKFVWVKIDRKPNSCQPYCMTKRQQKAALEYRRKNRKQYVAYSKAWKTRNPDWWKGRKMVQLLTSALVRGNDTSKVWKDADMTRVEWVYHDGDWSGRQMIHLLSNGSKLAPIKSWREFDLNDPSQVKQFLAPGNFKLVGK